MLKYTKALRALKSLQFPRACANFYSHIAETKIPMIKRHATESTHGIGMLFPSIYLIYLHISRTKDSQTENIHHAQSRGIQPLIQCLNRHNIKTLKADLEEAVRSGQFSTSALLTSQPY